MIRTEHLKKLYATEEVETTALNDVDHGRGSGRVRGGHGPLGLRQVPPLLNILGLLDNPSGGEYYFLDQEVSGHSERQRANLRKANIGFVFQSFQPDRRTHGLREHRATADLPGNVQAGAQGNGWTRPWSTCRSPTGEITSRSSSRAASSSAWPWRGRSSAIPS